MNRIFKFLFILLTVDIYAQSGGQGDKNLPNLIPPSLDNYQFVKYGNIDIENNKGGFNYNIPLIEIQEGEIKFPISVGYYSEGIKVNDIAGIVGMNWNINNTGIITRVVKDEPDEYYDVIKFRPARERIIEILNANYTDEYYVNNIKSDALLLFKSGLKSDANPEYLKVDNEQDRFNFNFNGISGIFFIDGNNIFLESDHVGLKASYTKTLVNGTPTLEFVFTTNNGTQYIFGGSVDFEEASTVVSPCSKQYGFPIASSWYLKTIRKSSNIINFTYKNYRKDYAMGYSESIKLFYPYNSICIEIGESEKCPTYFSSLTSKAVESIIYNKNKLLFEYEMDREDYQNGIYLKEIIQFADTTLIKKIDFKYSYSYNNSSNVPSILVNQSRIKKRLFLKEVQLSQDQVFKFEYNDYNSLPPRLSYKQDFYGYANSNSIQSLLNINDFDNNSNIKELMKKHFSYIDMANRNVSSLSLKGNLNKIIYPAGGYSVIDYENNTTEEDKPVENWKSHTFSVINSNCDSPNGPASFKEIEFESNGSPIIIENGANLINLVECEGVNTNLHNVHKLEIINTTTNEVYYNTQLTYEQTFRSYEGIHNNPHVGSFSPVVIPPGNWVKIKYTASSKYKTIEARLSLKYNRTIKTEKSPVNFSGARVKNLKSYYASGLTDHIKEFYYNPLNRLEQRGTSLHHFYSFNPWSYNCIKPSCESQQPNPAIDVNCSNLITFSSNNMMDALNERSARINYNYITVKENNKGFVEKNFLINGDVIHGSSGLQHEPPSTVSTSNYNAISDGKVKKVQIFDYNKVRQKSIVNDYGYYDEKKFINYQIEERMFLPLIVSLNQDQVFAEVNGECITLICNLRGKFRISFYNNYVQKYFIKSNETTEYLQGVPVSTETKYFYNNPAHFQLTSQKTTFPDFTTQETNYSYAHEKGNTFLTGKNMVGIPLETEVKKNGVVISKSETTYPVSQADADTKTSGLPLPVSVSSLDLQSNAMNMGVLYKKYDSRGNLLQYNLKPDANGNSGNPVTIIWDYNQTQPIAKIEGAKLSDIPQGLITNIVNASDYSNPSYSESNLIDQLDAFRIGLPGYQISTYTYKPLIGVSSITPPSGIREIYRYDTANRLQSVVDVDGNILKEYSYQYKQ